VEDAAVSVESSLRRAQDIRPPYVGVIVHYWAGGACWAAIVTAVQPDPFTDRRVALRLFPPPALPVLEGFPAVNVVTDVAVCHFDNTGAHNSWHHIDSWLVHDV
jgi:hypothetical protein